MNEATPLHARDEQFQKTIEYCHKAFTPLLGQFEEIGVIEYWPIKSLETWPFHPKQ